MVTKKYMIFVTKYISYCDSSYVLHPLTMAYRGPTLPFVVRNSYGTHLLENWGIIADIGKHSQIWAINTYPCTNVADLLH